MTTEPYNDQTEDQTRREIAQNEADTVTDTIRIFNALCLAVAVMPFVRIYIDRGEPLPVSDDRHLIQLSKAIDSQITGKTLPALLTLIRQKSLKSWILGERLSYTSIKGKVPENRILSLFNEGTFAHRERAAASFIGRTTRGLKLSDRVWRLERGIKTQIETTLQLAVLDGRSTMELANDLKQYLRQPNALFMKVREKGTDLQLSTAARQYQPGVGVYRSPYANAARLARNEINIAYRRADWETTQHLDFVTGIRIKTSNIHPTVDICDTLKGLYPKNFEWSGWHVSCRCHAIKEIITMKQFAQMEAGTYKPEQTSDTPFMFKEWLSENRHRFKENSGVDWIDNNPLYVKELSKK